MDVPRLVTSDQCLACRECCHFREPYGDWSPRLMPSDVIELEALAPDRHWADGAQRIVLKAWNGTHACSLLDTERYRCRVYERRPFECRLYPFVLSRETEGFKVYAHLSCPIVGEVLGTARWEAVVAEVRAYFSRPDVQAWVEQGAGGYPDYSRSRDQVVEVIAFDPAAALWQARPSLEEALGRQPRSLSALAFPALFAWKDFFAFDVRQVEGALAVFASQPAGTFLYWPPLGADVSPRAVAACFELMGKANRGGSLTRIENVGERDLGLFDNSRYRIERRGHEYVYAREDVARLAGHAYKSPRGEVNAFEREHAGAFTYRAYTPEDFNACVMLYASWAKQRRECHPDDTYRHMLQENRTVHRMVLNYSHRLGLTGRVVEVGGRVAAYTFGYPLSADTFCVLFEVADLSCRGLAAFIFSRFCGDEALARYTWINAMDDFAAPGLARAKMAWRPARLEPVHTVTLKDGR